MDITVAIASEPEIKPEDAPNGTMWRVSTEGEIALIVKIGDDMFIRIGGKGPYGDGSPPNDWNSVWGERWEYRKQLKKGDVVSIKI